MNEIKLIHAFVDQDGNINGLDSSGRLWRFREHEVKKKADNDGFVGEIGDVVYPVGWYPITMRKLESVGDYRAAGVKK